MNPEAQRIAIAEKCGWKRGEPYRCGDPRYHVEVRWTEPKFGAILEQLPDYLSDLNAMHEAE